MYIKGKQWHKDYSKMSKDELEAELIYEACRHEYWTMKYIELVEDKEAWSREARMMHRRHKIDIHAKNIKEIEKYLNSGA